VQFWLGAASAGGQRCQHRQRPGKSRWQQEKQKDEDRAHVKRQVAILTVPLQQCGTSHDLLFACYVVYGERDKGCTLRLDATGGGIGVTFAVIA
jgi:hypothetical protein